MYVQGSRHFESKLSKRSWGCPITSARRAFRPSARNLIMPYGGSQLNYGMSQILSTLDENMTKSLGKHQLQFGGRYRHERFGYLSDRSADTIAFSNQATAVYDPTTGANYGAKPNTGYADADFFLGAADSYSQVKNAPFGHYREQEFDFYIQDNYRVSPASHRQCRPPLGDASGAARRQGQLRYVRSQERRPGAAAADSLITFKTGSPPRRSSPICRTWASSSKPRSRADFRRRHL